MRAADALGQFTFFGLRRTHRIWSVFKVEVKVRGRAGSTLLIYDRGTAKARLGHAGLRSCTTHSFLKGEVCLSS